MTTFAAWTALAVALAALALAAALMWQSATTTAELRTHRRAHTEAHGHPDPRLDRRQINLAPPRATGDRRGTRYQPPPERLAPRPVEHAGPLTAAEADAIRATHTETVRCIHGRYRIDPCLGCGRSYTDGKLTGPFITDEQPTDPGPATEAMPAVAPLPPTGAQT